MKTPPKFVFVRWHTTALLVLVAASVGLRAPSLAAAPKAGAPSAAASAQPTGNGLGTARPSTESRLIRLEINSDNETLPQLFSKGELFVETHPGREFEVRLTNPLDVRLAVALAVDGQNSIDGLRVAARSARKWILAPRSSIAVQGWQLDATHLRKFTCPGPAFFADRKASSAPGAGRITALFFRESAPAAPRSGSTGKTAGARETVAAPPTAVPTARGTVVSRTTTFVAAPPRPRPGEQSGFQVSLAASGIGQSVQTEIRSLTLKLDPQPVQDITIRFAPRAELVRAGLLSASAAPGVSRAARKVDSHGYTRVEVNLDP